MKKITRVMWLMATLCLGLMASSGAQAQRSIRVDLGDFNFRFDGQSWNGDTLVDLSSDAQVRVNLPFLLNLGAGGPASYDVGFGENGFLSLVAAGAALPGTSAPSAGDFVAVRAADLATSIDNFGQTQWGVGKIDTFGAYDGITDTSTYSEANAATAVRFTWQGMCVATAGPLPTCDTSQPTTSFQAIFIDRGHGDFDLELNYNETFLAYGQRGFTLGSNAVALATGAFAGGSPDYCFRGGSAYACNDAIGVSVPEPAAWSLSVLGLVALGAWSRRRRPSGAAGAA